MHFDPTFAELPKGLLQLVLPESDDTAIAGLQRRSFLKLAAVSGFALGAFPLVALCPGVRWPEAHPAAVGLRPHRPDGTVTVTINRLDFGQGVQTGAADDPGRGTRCRLVQGAKRPRQRQSGLCRSGVRHAPDRRLQLDQELLHAVPRAGRTHPRDAGRRGGRPMEGRCLQPAHATTASSSAPAASKLGYGELAEAAMKLPVPDKVSLKDPKEFRLIGKPTGRLDARAKSSGSQAYGIDVRLPGMLTAVVAHPPVFGAKLKSVDDSAAKAVKGVKAVLRVPVDRGGEGVAVVADGYWPAKLGRDALKLEWDTTAVEKVDTRQAAGELPRARGQARRWSSSTPTSPGSPARRNRISAEYVFPYLAHAPMEPLNCTVGFQRRAPPSCGWARRCRASTAPPPRKCSASRRRQVKVNMQMAGGGFGASRHPHQRLRGRSLPGGEGRAGGRHRRADPHACGAARTTSRAATTGRCMCTAPRSASTRRATSWPGTT